MSDRQFIRISRRRSWHVVLTPTRLINGYRTLCGRLVMGKPVDTEPGDEKTCERCNVLAVRADDVPADVTEFLDGPA